MCPEHKPCPLQAGRASGSDTLPGDTTSVSVPICEVRISGAISWGRGSWCPRGFWHSALSQEALTREALTQGPQEVLLPAAQFTHDNMWLLTASGCGTFFVA